MIRNPKIPMLPTELPQQRIHEVVDLPARPTEFSSFINYGDMPEGTVSKNPPEMRFTCVRSNGHGRLRTID